MAENAGQKPQQAEPETTVAKEPQQAEPETTVAKEPQQAEPEPRQRTDWKAECRKWEERAKRSEQSLRDLKAANERAASVAEAARKAGVPADVLSRMEGDPEENAAILASALAPARGYKVTRDAGEPPAQAAEPMREAARALFGGRNQ
ncbi:hypothetical protein [Collinsella aerofaciens]|uniref:hypothetical protein n=1 Tax=Collinsella aerofaciens TaxID=74426 RepID=UPI0034A1DA2F